MKTTVDYSRKFEFLAEQDLYKKLTRRQQESLQQLAFRHRFTFQEFRRVVEVCRDLSMWGEVDLEEWWHGQMIDTDLKGRQLKKHLLQQLETHITKLTGPPVEYPDSGLKRPEKRRRNPVVMKSSDATVMGMCPVASERTVCCNLRTIDAVENCAYGCSYCAIQTFYSDSMVFDENFAEKLEAISLEPGRFYHLGTGQSSDSLVWGNRGGVLDALRRFAEDHPNVLLELKTKSDNTRDLLARDVPPNMVCSWSLNTPTIIENEEHYTGSLERRIRAARRVADRGVGVAFHFHPMVYHAGWQADYQQLAATVLKEFAAEEVVFLSMGSLTLIKPVLQKIRELGLSTKISQVDFVPDPHGKLTYADEIKVELFRTMYHALQEWHQKVFIYLCMEKATIWEDTFGFVYANNEEFEQDLGARTMQKLAARTGVALCREGPAKWR